jgi:hypothetical protein
MMGTAIHRSNPCRYALLSRWMLIAWGSLLLPLAQPADCHAESFSNDDAVRRGTNSAWVDSQSESVSAPNHQLENQDYTDRHESINTRSNSSKKNNWAINWFNSSGGNSAFGDFLSLVFGSATFWTILIVSLLLFLLLSLWWRRDSSRSMPRFRKTGRNEEDIEGQRARISDLPFDLEQPVMGLRAQAEKLASAGDYSRAIIYLFSYLLVELDQSHCIRLERGKTNGAYLRELTPQHLLLNYMKPAIQLFELSYFGKHPIDRGSFEALWSKINSFEQTLAQIRDASNKGDFAKRAGIPQHCGGTA